MFLRRKVEQVIPYACFSKGKVGSMRSTPENVPNVIILLRSSSRQRLRFGGVADSKSSDNVIAGRNTTPKSIINVEKCLSPLQCLHETKYVPQGAPWPSIGELFTTKTKLTFKRVIVPRQFFTLVFRFSYSVPYHQSVGHNRISCTSIKTNLKGRAKAFYVTRGGKRRKEIKIT